MIRVRSCLIIIVLTHWLTTIYTTISTTISTTLSPDSSTNRENPSSRHRDRGRSLSAAVPCKTRPEIIIRNQLRSERITNKPNTFRDTTRYNLGWAQIYISIQWALTLEIWHTDLLNLSRRWWIAWYGRWWRCGAGGFSLECVKSHRPITFNVFIWVFISENCGGCLPDRLSQDTATFIFISLDPLLIWDIYLAQWPLFVYQLQSWTWKVSALKVLRE